MAVVWESPADPQALEVVSLPWERLRRAAGYSPIVRAEMERHAAGHISAEVAATSIALGALEQAAAARIEAAALRRALEQRSLAACRAWGLAIVAAQHQGAPVPPPPWRDPSVERRALGPGWQQIVLWGALLGVGFATGCLLSLIRWGLS